MNAILECINAKDVRNNLNIRPLAGRIGAQIHDLALSDDLDCETMAAIRAALVRHKVLFFRDQAALTDHEHEEFAAQFGEPIKHPTVPPAAGSRYLLDLDSREGHTASVWHTDLTFVDAYPKMTALRALTIPEMGGDTLWANTAAAYEALPDNLKSFVDTLWATHSNAFDAPPPSAGAAAAGGQRAAFMSTIYETEHPVVHIHPESGERCLILGAYLKRFVGLGDADSHRLLAILQDHVTRPENTVRWRWRVGDVAIWDNRATQHRAIADFGKQLRVLRRVAVAGDVPISIDGRQSRVIRPEPQNRSAAA